MWALGAVLGWDGGTLLLDDSWVKVSLCLSVLSVCLFQILGWVIHQKLVNVQWRVRVGTETQVSYLLWPAAALLWLPAPGVSFRRHKRFQIVTNGQRKCPWLLDSSNCLLFKNLWSCLVPSEHPPGSALCSLQCPTECVFLLCWLRNLIEREVQWKLIGLLCCCCN